MDQTKMLAHSLTSKQRSQDVILSENLSFNSLILPPETLKGLAAAGFEKPSPIQVKALPVGRCGFDLMVKSKSGTGKTLVFGIISLESIKLDKPDPQVLIVAPTREIAVQIQEVILSIGKYYEGLAVESFIGGLPLAGDKSKCKLCHIAVGTPGRLKQLIKENLLSVEGVKIFVLDEADKLMEESFQNDINDIYNTLPSHKQIIMCSATYPEQMQTFLEQYMLSPVTVSVELETPLLLGLKHYVRLLKSTLNVVQQTKLKNDELLKILSAIPFIQCLIFSNYQTRAESVSNFLNRNNWSSIFMSAAQNQTTRLHSLSDLKEFKKKILVTTDLTARGIDAPNVDLVINYDVPINATTYLHRMGRAGRYGSTGNCINIAFKGQESQLLQNILGVIGGETLSIPIVDESFNLSNNEADYLFGQVGEELKDFNAYNSKISEIRNSFCEKNDSKTSSVKLKTPEPENKDAILLLQQLANEGEPENEDAILMLQQLANEGALLDTKQPEDTYAKNKALVGVAKMLSNVEVSNEDFNQMSAYLKAEREDVEILKVNEPSENPQVMENIFSLAFKSQIDEGAQKWQNLLSEKQKTMLSDDYDDDDEAQTQADSPNEDYDFEIEKQIEIKENNFMEWVPVEPLNYVAAKPKTQPLTSYEGYYQHCSNNLWQNGLSFETVESFDQWYFNDWESQLRTVRNFVQNKIYLEEMSKNN
ncbi:unnamed protein product [Ceutorhynchus assimilis]|uniref:RNA helicase n=1 Tax=Ceutorhynchus assimilis TaxID=467358 RepID=A0A9N9QJV3_9CUCU|nr:unnamed protein product [Ceutorhynchus assimilis]